MGNKLSEGKTSITLLLGGYLGQNEVILKRNVKKIDLTASIVNNIGYVKGTIRSRQSML